MLEVGVCGGGLDIFFCPLSTFFFLPLALGDILIQTEILSQDL